MKYKQYELTEPENTDINIGTRTYKICYVTSEYLKCKDEVNKICQSIMRTISSVKEVLEIVISSDTTGQLKAQYQYCLKLTISIALDDVDELIKKHNVVEEKEIMLLREAVLNLQDDVEVF